MIRIETNKAYRFILFPSDGKIRDPITVKFFSYKVDDSKFLCHGTLSFNINGKNYFLRDVVHCNDSHKNKFGYQPWDIYPLPDELLNYKREIIGVVNDIIPKCCGYEFIYKGVNNVRT